MFRSQVSDLHLKVKVKSPLASYPTNILDHMYVKVCPSAIIETGLQQLDRPDMPWLPAPVTPGAPTALLKYAKTWHSTHFYQHTMVLLGMNFGITLCVQLYIIADHCTLWNIYHRLNRGDKEERLVQKCLKRYVSTEAQSYLINSLPATATFNVNSASFSSVNSVNCSFLTVNTWQSDTLWSVRGLVSDRKF